jgi:class 3 adenylate cyclase/tetratricopeptide (TPR) repeat protein
MSESVDELLERAGDALDRARWDEVEQHATAALQLDPDCAEAVGLVALARRRRGPPSDHPAEFEAERRTLTVMFCDLVGSTEIADRYDPEDTREVLQWYHALVGEVVERYGGFVARYMGDGALVYFGWPTAIDSSALCAVRTALDLLHGVDAGRAELRRRLGTEIDLRIGVHTGLVVVGAMGSRIRVEHDDVVGDTPNIAARLEGLAAPGTVVVSADTYALVRDRVDATALGPQRLKGISRPIEVHRVDGVVDHAMRFVPDRVRVPIVGRSSELTGLVERLDAVERSGVGGFVAISAEPGVGKSRLLETFLGSLPEHVTVVKAQCNEFLVGTAFHPILDAVRRRGAADADSATGPMALGGRDELDVVDDEDRSALLARVAEWLLEPGEGRSVVVAVEDVHWADPSTLDVLELLTDRARALPALVLVTHRPEQVPEWLETVDVVHLQPLGRAEFDRFVGSLAGDRTFPSEVLAQLFDRTGGVPLFVEELVRSLIDFGAAPPSEPGEPAEAAEHVERVDRTGPAETFEIPASLNDVLVTRLDRCGPAKRTGQVASVFGRSVTVDLLREVAGVAELDVHLDLLVRAGVLERDGDDAVRFRHALVQDAAYSTMLRSTARTIHGRVAAAITSLRPEVAERSPEIIARHLHQAGRHREALDRYRAAAEHSKERSAFHETVAHLTGARACLAALDEPMPDLELEVLLQLGPALLAARGYGSDEVKETYQRAAELSGAAPESVAAFGVLHGLNAFFLVTEDLERSGTIAASMAEHAARRDDPDDMLEAQAWLGTLHFFRGRLAEAERVLSLAADSYRVDEHAWHADRFGLDPAILSLSHLSWLLLVRGDLDGAERRRDQMLDIAECLDRPVARAHALNYAAGLAVLTGDAATALRHAAREWAIADEAGLPHYVAYSQILAAAARRDTDPSAAAEQLRAGLRLRRETGARLAIAFHHALLADLELAAGRAEEAHEVIVEARRLAVELDERWWYPEIERVAGEVELRLGRPEVATECWNRSLAAARDSGAAWLAARTQSSMAGSPRS